MDGLTKGECNLKNELTAYLSLDFLCGVQPTLEWCRREGKSGKEVNLYTETVSQDTI